MLFTLLRIVDVLALLAALLSVVFPASWVGFAGVLLFAKGLLFSWTLDVVSFLDMICGLVLIGMALGFSFMLLKVIVILFLAQKVVMSFFLKIFINLYLNSPFCHLEKNNV